MKSPFELFREALARRRAQREALAQEALTRRQTPWEVEREDQPSRKTPAPENKLMPPSPENKAVPIGNKALKKARNQNKGG